MDRKGDLGYVDRRDESERSLKDASVMLLLECTYCNHTVCSVSPRRVFLSTVNSVYRTEAEIKAAEKTGPDSDLSSGAVGPADENAFLISCKYIKSAADVY